MKIFWQWKLPKLRYMYKWGKKFYICNFRKFSRLWNFWTMKASDITITVACSNLTSCFRVWSNVTWIQCYHRERFHVNERNMCRALLTLGRSCQCLHEEVVGECSSNRRVKGMFWEVPWTFCLDVDCLTFYHTQHAFVNSINQLRYTSMCPNAVLDSASSRKKLCTIFPPSFSSLFSWGIKTEE